MGPNPPILTHSRGVVRLEDAERLTGLRLERIQKVPQELEINHCTKITAAK